ncbi:MAG: HEAT repeat domain-containing protein [Deltaproteobacteria bacterium]|nr:HEAT repeat domain-containing protein [Deltaproteobacteria bacterium]
MSKARPELSRRVEGPVEAIERPASLRDKAGKAKESEALSYADLERKALSDPDPNQRIAALDELTEEKNRQGAVGVLIQVLQSDREVEVRRAALEGLEEIEALSLEVLSQTALNDPEASLRVRAIELIGDRDEKGKRTIDLLKRIAQIDQNKEVRQAAIELLEEMGMGN